MKLLLKSWRDFLEESEKPFSVELSDAEKNQLGQFKQLQKDKLSKYRHPTIEEWKRLREILVARSLKSNPSLNPDLTAYTPGETLKLFEHPKIKEWHTEIANFKVPEKYGTVLFVPCAKTKPWACATRGIYKSYNQIRAMVEKGEMDPVYFVTISEPLGIVPQDKWADFPQYDNPGLFADDAQRSGLFTKDWDRYGFEKMIVPFDATSYKKAISILAKIIEQFLKTNEDKKFLAFVKDFQGMSTHSHMLNVAQKKSGVEIDRHFKRERPRQPPHPHILKILGHDEEEQQ
jgi:hypothetical protein